MKRWVHSSKEFDHYNYGSNYVIQSSVEGWNVFENSEKIAGPFTSWLDAQDYIDELDAQ